VRLLGGSVAHPPICEDRCVLVEPLIRPSTYRRWVYLILGGAVLVPFMLLAAMVLPALLPTAVQRLPVLVALTTVLLVLGLMVPMSFIPGVRVIEGTAARELLGDRVPEHAARRATSWADRWRCATWFVVHLVVGGLVSALTLALPPFAVLSLAVPFTGSMRIFDIPLRFEPGWASVWVPALGLLSLVLLVYLVAGTGAALARLAISLLGPTAGERLAELYRRTERLAERNRLARELHDSVGHALSVVTIQASAAGRVLDSDPGFARRALGAIEESARTALEDLDHVLGLLREERAPVAPQWTLADLPTLLDKTRLAGVAVTSDVEGSVADLPPVVSREAYRIVQEGLTNVLRHAGKVPALLRLVADSDRLELALSNPLTGGPATRNGGGHGLRGMRERVAVLRGEMSAGPDDGRWTVRVRIPLRTTQGAVRG
jgi:signal transduction histidine kinase